MKTNLRILLAATVGFIVAATNLPAQETNTTPARVGVYDSRAVAYAWFWSDAHQRQFKAEMQQARAAQSAGETNRFQKLAAGMAQLQAEMHREVFSTAPPEAALAALKEQLPKIQKEAQVIALVSKWDATGLKRFPSAETVDVTGQLVNEFKLTEKQLKTVLGIEQSTPLPLEKCNELIRQGKI